MKSILCVSWKSKCQIKGRENLKLKIFGMYIIATFLSRVVANIAKLTTDVIFVVVYILNFVLSFF